MKKFLSILCSVMMLINSVPFTAFAEEPVQADPPVVVEQQEEIIAEPVEVPVEVPADPEPVDIPVEEPADIPVEEPVVVPAEEPVVVPEEPQEEPEEEPAPAPAPVEEPAVVPAENGEGTSSEVPADNSGEGQAVVTEPGTGTEPGAEVVTPAEPAVVEPEIIPNDVDGTIDNEGSYAGGFDHNFPTQLVRLNMTYGRKLRFSSRGMDVYVIMQSEDDANEAPITLFLWDALTQGPGQDFSQIEYVHTGSWMMTIMPMQAGANGGFRLMVSEYKEKEVVIEPAVKENTAGSEKEKEEPEIEPVITPVEPEVLTPVEVEVEEEPTPEVVPVVTNENEGTDPVLDGTDDTDETGKDVPDENKNPEEVIIEEEIEEEEIEEVVIEEPIDVEEVETEEAEEVTGSEPRDGEDEEEAAEGEEGEKTEGESEEGEVPSEEVTEEETEETEEEIPEVAMPAATLNAQVGQTTITVNAPEGAFPEGIQLRAVQADPKVLLSAALIEIGYSADEVPALAQAIIESGADLSAYIQNFDLTFYLPENPEAEIEPEKEVEVIFGNLTINTEDVAVFSNDGESVDKLDSDTSGDDVSVTVPSFSGKGVVDIPGLAGLAEGAKGAKGGEDGDSSKAGNRGAIEDFIRQWYINGNTPTIHLNISDVPLQSGNDPLEVEAGSSELQYHVTLSVETALTYNVGWGAPRLFDVYNNVSVDITLPDGLSVVIPPNGINGVQSIQHTPGSQTWTFVIGDVDATSGHDETFDFNVYVEDNGLLEIGHQFKATDFDGSIHLEFTPFDKTEQSAWVALDPVSKDLGSESYPNGAISVSDDQWMIDKQVHKVSPHKDGFKVSDDKTKVTVYFKIDVGLKGDNNKVVYNWDTYLRDGRVPFESVTLADSLTELKDRNGNVISPESLVISKDPDFPDGSTANLLTSSPVNINVGQTLGLDTVSGTPQHAAQAQEKDVHKDAPYLTTYYVKAVYPYEKFIANYYDPDTSDLTVQNNATLTYVRKGENKTNTNSDSDTVDIGEVTKPASLQINKLIKKYDGDSTYGATTQNHVTGTYEFKIFKVEKNDNNEDVESDAVLYQYNSETKKYTKEDDNVISIDLATGNTGVYYLDPGHYIIRELDGTPASWITVPATNKTTGQNDDLTPEKGTVEFNFVNEEVLGEIKVIKNDETGAPLAGATITVFEQNGTDIAKDAYGTNLVKVIPAGGTWTFKNVKIGHYVVKETQAPANYIIDMTPHSVEVTSSSVGTNVVTVTFVNRNNIAKLNLSKLISTTTVDADGNAKWENLQANFKSEYDKKFQLQKSEDNGTTWVDVGTPLASTDLATGTAVNKTWNLPVYVVNNNVMGNAIQYRIVETVPSGWYYVNSDGSRNTNTSITSDAVTLTQTLSGITTVKDQTITFRDRKTMKINLEKKFYSLNTTTGVMEVDGSTREITVGLYKKVGNSFVQVGQNVTTTNKKYTWDNIQVFDDSGKKIEYYVKEVPVNGYTLITVNENEYVRITDPETTLNPTDGKVEGSVELKNVEHKVAVLFVKEDYNTGAFVDGSEVTVSHTGTKGKVYDPGNNMAEVTGGTAINDPSTLLFLEVGDNYTFSESTVPEDYEWKSTEPSSLDLTNFQVTDTQAVTTVVIKNQSKPKIQVDKRKKYSLTESGDGSELDGVVFEIYHKVVDQQGEHIVPYQKDGQTVTITGDEEVSVDEGTYFLRETNAYAKGSIDPDVNHEIYGTAVVEADDHHWVFGPYTVENKPAGETTNVTVVRVTNAENKAGVRVYKRKWRGHDPQVGVSIGVRAGTETDPTQTGVTVAPNGTAEFYDLPVYDQDGHIIPYTLYEITPPSGYYAKVGSVSTTLVPGKIIETVNGAEKLEDDSNLLVLYNDVLAGFNIGKQYFSDWEYTNYTHKTYPLPNTEVAVYKRVGEEGSYTYTLVKFDANGVASENGTNSTVKTTETGSVLVTGLDPDSVYIAVEVAIPAGADYEYLTPTKTNPDTAGTPPIEYDYRGYLNKPVPDTLSDLSKLNYVTRPAAASGATEDQIVELGTALHNLYNVKDWTQIDVTKFKAQFEEGADLSGDINHEPPMVAGTKTPSDHAIFYLYVQDLRKTGIDYDADPGIALTFNADNCTFIKELTSGSYYDANNVRQPGEFVTPVLDCAPWLVYWIVEIQPESGTSMIPGQIHSLYVHPDATVTNAHNPTRRVKYKQNKTVKDEILNKVNEPVGGGSLRYASIRLSKWAAIVKGSGYDTEKYDPLGGVKFNIYICDEDLMIKSGVIDNIIVGLDDSGYAGGQSSDFVLIIDKDGNVTTFKVGTTSLMDYAQYIDYEINDGHKDYFFYVAIQEDKAPAEYTYDGDYYYEKVYFLATSGSDDEGWTFNDAYLVTNAAAGNEDLAVDTQETPQRYAQLSSSTASGAAITARTVGDDKNRIVNYPVINNPVVVRKYAYIVNNANLAMTSEQLDTYYTTQSGSGRDKLPGVEMILEREVKTEGGGTTWLMWDYHSKDSQQVTEDTNQAKFTIDNNGLFRFPFGLTIGNYRIKEINVPETAAYENAYDGSWDHYRYFTVENADSRRITMYNPYKVSVVVEKTDAKGGALTGATFTLVNKDDTTKVIQGTAQGNKTIFDPVNTGFYYLTEGTVPAGYTKEYLEEYFHSHYDSDEVLYNFADSTTGVWIGINVSAQNSSNTTDYDEHNKGTIVEEYYGLSAGIQVIDPMLVDLKLIKQDLQDPNKKLKDVEFKVYQQLFDKTEGNYEIKVPSTLTNSAWTELTGPFKTDANGEIKIDDQLPGVYVFVEQEPYPEGYELVGGKNQWWVVVTGGMSITVTGHDIDVTDTDNAEVTVLAKNKKQAGVTIEKTFTENSLSSIGAWEATFELGQLKNGAMSVIKTVTLNQENMGPETISSKLSQGTEYYIRELDSTLFAFNRMLLVETEDGTEKVTELEKATLSGIDGNWYKFVADSAAGIRLRAENIMLRGEIEIQKWEDLEKADGTHELLPGASFKLVKVVDGVEKDVTGAVWEKLKDDQGKENGKYLVSFPMSDNTPPTYEATYRIYETDAPEGYLFQPDAHIDVVVKPGDHKDVDNQGVALHLINEGGFIIELIKYGNVYGTTNPLNPVEGAGFTLVQWDPSSSTWVKFGEEKKTDADGKVSFTARIGYAYALYESTIPAGFWALDSIHETDADGHPTDVALQASNTDYLGKTVYALQNNNDQPGWEVGKKYVFTAYNQPKVGFQVRKRDVSGSTIVPAAYYEVYKVNAEGFTTVSEAEVEAILKGQYDTDKFEQIVDSTLTSKGPENGTDDSGSFQYSFENVTDIEGGYTYLVIEKSVRQLQGTVPYDSLNKDDIRVVRYATIDIKRDAVTDYTKMYVMLKNVLGTATNGLDKDADNKTGRETLFAGPQDVKYTLTPHISNTTGLESFTVTDNGLTAYHVVDGVSTLVYDYENNGTKEFRGYNILSVETSAAAKHDTTIYGMDHADISAIVSFYDFEGNKIDDDVEVPAGGTANKPTGNDAKSVVISYVAHDLQDATKETGFNGYALGKDFDPGDIILNVKLKKQDDGPKVYTIDRIYNHAESLLSYRNFDETGKRKDKTTDILAEAEVNIYFEQPDIPAVEIVKTSPAGSVTLSDDFDYYITLTNTDPKLDLIDPFVIDLLPRGTTFVSAVITTENSGLTIEGTSQYESGEGQQGAIPMTAIRINFKEGDKLKAGTSVQIKFTVAVDPEVALYGRMLQNFAFMSSTTATYKTIDNPTGAPFRDNKQHKDYADQLPEVGANLNPKLTKALADALVNMLGTGSTGIGEFGYVGSSVEDPWAGDSDMKVFKTIRGDQDKDSAGNLLDFSTTRIAQASNGSDTAGVAGGWVDYQLVMTNTSKTLNRNNIMFADMVPRPGDKQTIVGEGVPRQSEWQVNFGEIKSVTKSGSTEALDYKLFVYTGPLNDATEAIRTQLNNWKEDGDYASFAPSAPWTTIGNVSDKATITAFIVLINPSVKLANNESVVITLRTNVKYYPDSTNDPNEDTFFDVAYLNTINNFYTQYYSFGTDPTQGNPAPNPVPSNRVTAMLMPGEVQVGGNIWIDANNDGWQNDGDFSDYTEYEIVKTLMEHASVTLHTFRDKNKGKTFSGGTPTPGDIYDNNYAAHSVQPGAGRNAFVGEPEFLFEHLKSARMYTTPHYDEDGTLRVDHLKGEAPSTYILDINISSDAKKIFDLAKNSYSLRYQSDDPEYMKTLPVTAEMKIDNNFEQYYDVRTRFWNERFYLYASSKGSLTDMTKDIGFVPYRNLHIIKVAADDPELILEDAIFDVYGPFAKGTVTPENYNSSILNGPDIKKIPVLTGDGFGYATRLLWFMEYIIVERTAPANYELDGELFKTNTGTNVERLAKNTWILRVPDEKALPNPTNAEDYPGERVDEVTISDPRNAKIEVPLHVEKDLQGRVMKAGEFTFSLVDTNTEDHKYVKQEDIPNNADGTVPFDDIKFAVYPTQQQLDDGYIDITSLLVYPNNGNIGTFKLTLTLAEGTNLPDSVELVSGSPQTIEITVTHNKANCTLTVATKPEKLDNLVIKNKYTTKGEITFSGTKTLENRKLKEGEFTFELYEENGTTPIQTTTNAADGSYSFTKIEYTGADLDTDTNGNFVVTTKKYKVVEKIPAKTDSNYDASLTYDKTEYEITVTLTENGHGKIEAVANPKENTYDFTNTYNTKGEITFSGTKELVDRELKKDEFTFELYEENGTTPIQTTTNAADGSYSFEKIEYTGTDLDTDAEGYYVVTTKKYKVVEKIPAQTDANYDPSLTYDKTEYEITVTLTDDGHGKIEVVANPKENTYDFTNTYSTKGEITFSGTKTLENRRLKKDEFTFELYEENGTTPIQTTTNAADGSYSFEKIEYTGTDLDTDTDGNYVVTTKKYKVVEKIPAKTDANYDPSLTYDKTEYEITVTLTDDRHGKIEVVANPKENTYDFTNTYNTKGEITFSGKKTLEHRILKAGEFTFELYEENGTTPIQTTTNAADGSYTFEKIEYTGTDLDTDADGYYVVTTKKYKVVEKIPAQTDANYDASLTYDQTEYDITVTLTDDEHGTIGTVADPEEDTYDFVNTYDATGSIRLGGLKTVEKRDFIAGDEITFKLERVTEGAPMPANATTEDGKVIAKAKINPTTGTSMEYLFEKIDYVLANITEPEDATTHARSASFQYKITESECKMAVKDSSGKVIGDVVMDTTQYLITVTITDDTDDHPGKLDVRVTNCQYRKNDTEDWKTYTNYTNTAPHDDIDYYVGSGFNFNNPYHTTASLDIKALKVLTGRTIIDNEFTFTLTGNTKAATGRTKTYEINDEQHNTALNQLTGTNISFETLYFAVNPNDVDTTGMNPVPVYWDVEDLMSIMDSSKPNTVTVDLKVTENATTNMPIGVMPEGSSIPYSENVTIPVVMTITYDRKTGVLTASIDKDLAGMTFSNVYVTTEAAVHKIWDDDDDRDRIRPTDISVSLFMTYRGNTYNVFDPDEENCLWNLRTQYSYLNTLDLQQRYTLNKQNGWSYVVKGLPTSWNGDPITYSWKEVSAISGYTRTDASEFGTVDTNNPKLTTFTNRHTPAPFTVSVRKVWEDNNNVKQKRPTSIIVQLYADGVAEGGPETLDETNNWAHTWPNLKKFTNPTGEPGQQQAINYTVEEIDIPADYEVSYTSTSTDELKTYTITNRLPEGNAVIRKFFDATPEPPIFNPGLMNIPVVKTWNDNNNAAGARPGAITVHLYAGGIEVASQQMSEATGWRITFFDLPIFNENEEEIEYFVTEDPVPGYIGEVDGYNLINTYQPEVMSVAVQKIWADQNNAQGLRPASIRMTLSNGMSVVLSEANSWTAVISGLPATINGQPANYTWSEAAVPGYTLTSVQTGGSVTVFTNTAFQRPPQPGPVPPVPGRPVYVFEEYETPLGIAVEINHVGDCFD